MPRYAHLGVPRRGCAVVNCRGRTLFLSLAQRPLPGPLGDFFRSARETDEVEDDG